MTIYPDTYSSNGKRALAERLNISMDTLNDSVAIYRLRHSHGVTYEVIEHGLIGNDLVEQITAAVAERSNN
jgi:hypothetical protein